MVFTKNFLLGIADFSKRKASVAGSIILGNHTDFFPYLPRITLGLSYWVCIWTILLFLVQVCSQEFTAILSHARSCRYVWFKSLVPLGYLENLSKKSTHSSGFFMNAFSLYFRMARSSSKGYLSLPIGQYLKV